MINKNSCVAIYENHQEAEQAVKELERSGFNMRELYIIGKGYEKEDHVLGYYNTGERVKFWGKQGAFWGGLWGILFGSVLFSSPGMGIFLASTLIGGVQGAVLTGSLGALGAALYSIRIPKDSIIKYETAIKSDKYLLIVRGSSEEVERARYILNAFNEGEIELFLA